MYCTCKVLLLLAVRPDGTELLELLAVLPEVDVGRVRAYRLVGEAPTDAAPWRRLRRLLWHLRHKHTRAASCSGKLTPFVAAAPLRICGGITRAGAAERGAAAG